ncbi:MAG: hypothetical protein D3915_00475 [Candidatus Electrothrix sp. AU1_5]|nr:hypothetical protein [Candidatus Electrothrix gigas]
MSKTPTGLLKWFKPYTHLVLVTTYPAMTLCDGIKQIDYFIFQIPMRSKPVNHVFAGVPHAGSYKVKEFFALVINTFKFLIIFNI